MALNSITAERPFFGSALAMDWSGLGNTLSTGLFRVWQHLGGTRYACWGVMNTGNLGGTTCWPGIQCPTVVVGTPKKCWSSVLKAVADGSDDYSFPDGNWTYETSGSRYYTDYYSALTRRLRWTAPRDYDGVCIKFECSNSHGTANVTYTPAGTPGTLLRATLDTTTAGPFAPDATGYKIGLCNQKFITIATDVKQGDTIDFASADGNEIVFLGLFGYRNQVGDPAAEECVMLGKNVLADGDPSLDSTVSYVCDNIEGKGHTLALALKGGAAASKGVTSSYWGSVAHANAANTIGGDATASVLPAVSWLYTTAAAPTGTAWAPAVGERTDCQTLICTISGTAVAKFTDDATTYAIGTYREIHQWDSAGYTCFWEIYANGTLPTFFEIGTGGYVGMTEFASDFGAGISPGGSARVSLTKDDDSFSLQSQAGKMILYGGNVSPAVVEFMPLKGCGIGSITLMVQERIAASANKVYAAMTQYTNAAPLTISANDRFTGGFRINIYDRTAFRTIVPSGGSMNRR